MYIHIYIYALYINIRERAKQMIDITSSWSNWLKGIRSSSYYLVTFLYIGNDLQLTS